MKIIMSSAVVSVVATNLVVGVYRPDDGINTGKKRENTSESSSSFFDDGAKEPKEK